MNGLLARAVLAFLVLPGTVAFLIPWLLVEPGQSGQFVDARGSVPLLLGIVLLLWCVVLWGWALGFRSRAIVVYALLVMLAFYLRVILGEEPWLARAHGEEWVRYKAQVPRWFGFHRPSA